MRTSNLIGWTVPIVFVSVLSCICMIADWMGRPEKSHYVECMRRMNLLVEIFEIDPTKYVGKRPRDIHARLIEEYLKEYPPETMKDLPRHLELGEDGYILDPWLAPFAIIVEECVREGGLVCKLRISSAGRDGVFNSPCNDDVVVEKVFPVRSGAEEKDTPSVFP